MHWGKHKENGFWFAPSSQTKFLFGGGDRLLYIALGKVRLRIMKPHNSKSCTLSPCCDNNTK